jgi:carboxyl-terminal processing protease
MAGQFGGLGIQISEQNGVPKVISPIDGTPAAHAGVQPGDLIAAIDGQSTQGVGLNKIVRVLRGKPGTKVTLSLVRGSKDTVEVTITRDIIQVQTVKAKLEPNNIGYARITEFGENTQGDFKKAIENLKQQSGGNLKGLVLDLRNDPGGLLSAAVAISGNFLSGGKVVTIHGRNATDDHVFNAPVNATLLSQQTPIVVLVNGASASASEIVAGALQDRKRAIVMGTQSFGKGSVQTVIPLNGKGALRLTTALYYTPSGRSIQGQGITPNEVVDVPKDQQIEGGFMLSESKLQGAFSNPGALGGKPTLGGEDAQPVAARPATSAPIKIDLIATDQDAQLKAALAHLEHAVANNSAVKQ